MYDIEKVRADFPILSRTVYDKPLVYLDNAVASTGSVSRLPNCTSRLARR